MSRYDRIIQQFHKQTSEHQLEVILDDAHAFGGHYRHLRVKKPGTGIYGFDIMTWPGHLAITGDLGTAMFTRSPDMLAFFRPGKGDAPADGGLYINPSYWAEKCSANDGPILEFDEELLRGVLREHFDEYIEEQDVGGEEFATNRDALWKHIEDEIVGCSASTYEAVENMRQFSVSHGRGYGDMFRSFVFSDPGDYATSMKDYTARFIYRLLAIALAVKLFDARGVR